MCCAVWCNTIHVPLHALVDRDVHDSAMCGAMWVQDIGSYALKDRFPGLGLACQIEVVFRDGVRSTGYYLETEGNCFVLADFPRF